MARVEDIGEAQDMVCSLYPNLDDPQPYNFEIYKQGYTWVVKYNLLTVMDFEEHDVHINAITGKMVRIK